MAHVVWILNLDAEDELARLPRVWTRQAAAEERLARAAVRLGSLLRGEPVLGAHQKLTGEFFARTWCPTPSALAAASALGLTLPEAPAWPILRRVNHRSFSAALGQTLPRAAFVSSATELESLLDRAAAGESWILKRPLGYAGRGRRKVWAKKLTQADRHWIERSFLGGEGLQAEPEVERVLDCALHGYLFPDGAARLGSPALQRCDASGAWLESSIASPGDLAEDELEQLHEAAAQTHRALHHAGYFGPFGIDAYRWRDPRGEIRFQPRSEINARYSMGWGVGMGNFRPPVGLP